MADRTHEVADEVHRAGQASSQDLSADAGKDGSHSAVDLVLHMILADGGNLASHLVDSNSDHEVSNLQADSVDEDRLGNVQEQKYYLGDCKQDLLRTLNLLCLEAEEGMVDVEGMAAGHLIPLVEVCGRDCHCKATVQVARKP